MEKNVSPSPPVPQSLISVGVALPLALRSRNREPVLCTYCQSPSPPLPPSPPPHTPSQTKYSRSGTCHDVECNYLAQIDFGYR